MNPAAARTGVVEPTMGRLAVRLGITVGQAYTVCTGLVVAVVLGALGLPPVLRGADGAIAAAASIPGGEAAADGGGVPIGSASPAAPAAPLGAVVVPFHPAADRPPEAVPADDGTGADPAPTTTTSPPSATPAGTTSVLASVPAPGAPEGIGVAPDGTIYVATDNAVDRGGPGPSAILAFHADGAPIGSWSIGSQPDDRTIGLTGLAVDGHGAVWVLDASTARILRLDPGTSTVSVVASVPDVGPCLVPVASGCEPGVGDARPEPRGIAFDDRGRALVTDRAQGLVWRVGADGAVAPFATIDDRVPGEGPFGVTVDASGSVVVTVTGLLSALPPGQAALVSIAVGDDGTAGARTTLATFDASARPAGVVAGAGGSTYVALAGDDAVVAIGADGTAQRYDGAGVTPGFDAPTGVALRDGALLLTNQSTADDPARWVVHAVVVDDRPIDRR